MLQSQMLDESLRVRVCEEVAGAAIHRRWELQVSQSLFNFFLTHRYICGFEKLENLPREASKAARLRYDPWYAGRNLFISAAERFMVSQDAHPVAAESAGHLAIGCVEDLTRRTGRALMLLRVTDAAAQLQKKNTARHLATLAARPMAGTLRLDCDSDCLRALASSDQTPLATVHQTRYEAHRPKPSVRLRAQRRGLRELRQRVETYDERLQQLHVAHFQIKCRICPQLFVVYVQNSTGRLHSGSLARLPAKESPRRTAAITARFGRRERDTRHSVRLPSNWKGGADATGNDRMRGTESCG